VSRRPRWHGHPYNRAGLYRLAEALSVLPRGLRLALARQVARLAPPLLPVERRADAVAVDAVGEKQRDGAIAHQTTPRRLREKRVELLHQVRT